MKHNFINKIIDHKSLKFKLWAYFALFALAIIVLLWFLQIVFVRYYYQDMKINETNKIALSIIDQFGKENFIERLNKISATNDLYIHVEMADGAILYSPIFNEETPPAYVYFRELSTAREQLLLSGNSQISIIIEDNLNKYNSFAYAREVSYENVGNVRFFIFSPLYPVDSTITILKNQLFYVTIISLLAALLVGKYLSNVITKPLSDISSSAMHLARGEFGTVFHGEHYTEIINLADTLTYTSIELEKAAAQQKDLMANVSHDLKTPLTMVKSYAEMIRDLSGDNPEKRNAHLQVIIDEADRLNLLVSDMLTLSRMQTGSIVLEKTYFSLKEAVQSIIQSFGILTEQEGYIILLDCPADVIIHADESKIKQVISNLLTNAIKYCGNDRTVIVSVKQSHGKVRCSVTDHGVGIPEEDLDRIWERYYKASTNHVRSAGGTGLGLSIVKEILLLHNAKYGVDSHVGKGSTFWFELRL